MTETILRLLTMLRMLPRAPRKIDTAALERRLGDEGYPVTLRTIQRDLAPDGAGVPAALRRAPPGRVVRVAMALADMDVVINPTTRTVEVNPESPNIGTSWAR